MNIPVALISGAVGALLGLGGALATLRRAQKDVNGVGGRVRQLEKEHIILLMLLCPEDKKQWLAGILLRK